MNKEVSKIEYHINSFMYKLGIKNSALKVYAALYSFTKGEIGVYYGSKKYLASALGINEKTLYNALKELRGRGLIEDGKSIEGRFFGIRCIELTEKKELEISQAPEKEKAAEPSAVSEVERGEDTEEDARDNNEGNEEEELLCEVERVYGRGARENFHSLPDHEKNTIKMMLRYERRGDNRRFLSFGNGGVIMTEEQYKRLLLLLPSEELMVYFSKLENMLRENEKSGRKPPHSHYKVIKKWIEEDMEV